MKNLTIAAMFAIAQFSFGQESVQPFLPELFSQFPNVRDFTVSMAGDEAYFTAQSYAGELSIILGIQKQDGLWSQPEFAPFSGRYQDLEPAFSPDALTLFFASNRPLNNASGTEKDFDIWYVQRKNRSTGWSEPVNLGSPINSEHGEFYPSVSNNKNMYFTSDRPGTKGQDDIFVSLWENDGYAAPVSLSDSINSEGYEFNAFIAADESFLIFSGYNRADGLGSGDLYISFRQADGQWSRAKNLREANSEKLDYCPFVPPGSTTLYFTSKRTRVKAGMALRSLSDLLREMHQPENGLSRIYQISLDHVLSLKERIASEKSR